MTFFPVIRVRFFSLFLFLILPRPGFVHNNVILRSTNADSHGVTVTITAGKTIIGCTTVEKTISRRFVSSFSIYFFFIFMLQRGKEGRDQEEERNVERTLVDSLFVLRFRARRSSSRIPRSKCRLNWSAARESRRADYLFSSQYLLTLTR